MERQYQPDVRSVDAGNLRHNHEVDLVDRASVASLLKVKAGHLSISQLGADLSRLEELETSLAAKRPSHPLQDLDVSFGSTVRLPPQN